MSAIIWMSLTYLRYSSGYFSLAINKHVEGSRQTSNLTPNGPTGEDSEAALVLEVPETLPTHCLLLLHKSCPGALAFQPASSRLVFATIATTQWE